MKIGIIIVSIFAVPVIAQVFMTLQGVAAQLQGIAAQFAAIGQ